MVLCRLADCGCPSVLSRLWISTYRFGALCCSGSLALHPACMPGWFGSCEGYSTSTYPLNVHPTSKACMDVKHALGFYPNPPTYMQPHARTNACAPHTHTQTTHPCAYTHTSQEYGNKHTHIFKPTQTTHTHTHTHT